MQERTKFPYNYSVFNQVASVDAFTPLMLSPFTSVGAFAGAFTSVVFFYFYWNFYFCCYFRCFGFCINILQHHLGALVFESISISTSPLILGFCIGINITLYFGSTISITFDLGWFKVNITFDFVCSGINFNITFDFSFYCFSINIDFNITLWFGCYCFYILQTQFWKVNFPICLLWVLSHQHQYHL